jgi:tetratricopeptide (TPR) repeat protein
MRKLLITITILATWLVAAASTPVVTGAKIRISAKKFQEAVEVLEENKGKYPNDPELYYFLARAYAGIGQWVAAGDNFNLALQKSPDKKLKKEIDKYRNFHWTSFVKEASALLQRERYPEAIGKYRLANSINPDRKESHADLGVALLNQAQLYESAEPPQPDSAALFYDGAIQSFQTAIELDPEDQTYVKNLGYAYMAAGNEEDAIDIYEKFLEEYPDDFDMQRRLLSIYMSASNYEQASEIYTQWLDDAGLEIGTDISMADLYNAGLCYYQLFFKLDKMEDEESKQRGVEMLTKAAECYSMVYEDTPTDCDAGTQLYYIYITLAEWQQSVETIGTMLDNGCPRDLVTLQNLGVGYMKLDNKVKAAEVFKELDELKKQAEGSN